MNTRSFSISRNPRVLKRIILLDHQYLQRKKLKSKTVLLFQKQEQWLHHQNCSLALRFQVIAYKLSLQKGMCLRMIAKDQWANQAPLTGNLLRQQNKDTSLHTEKDWIWLKQRNYCRENQIRTFKTPIFKPIRVQRKRDQKTHTCKWLLADSWKQLSQRKFMETLWRKWNSRFFKIKKKGSPRQLQGILDW